MVLDKRNQHRPEDAKQQHRTHLALPAQYNADGNAGQRTVTERIREERHLIIDCHCAQHAEKRRNQDDCNQRILHKRVMQPLKGQQRIHQGIKTVHARPPLV